MRKMAVVRTRDRQHKLAEFEWEMFNLGAMWE